MSTPSDFNIPESLAQFNTFENQKNQDSAALKAKIQIWQKMSTNPEVLLMLFCVMIMASGGPFDNTYAQKTGMKADGSSITKNQEDLIEETGKEMNYVSAYRNATTDIKSQLDLGKDGTGSAAQIQKDLDLMVNNWSSAIFGGDSKVTFDQAQKDIQGVLDDIKNGTFKDLNDLWVTSQMGPTDPNYNQAKVTKAGNDIQQLTNAINNVFSTTSVNSNALGAQLQNTEGDYKSDLSVVEKMMQSLFQIISQCLKSSGS